MATRTLPSALDEKNASDFAEITKRIHDALEKIRQTPKLKPSQAVLATLAQCSRGTLNNRKWPLEELLVIKEKRKAQKAAVAMTIPAVVREESRIEQLNAQLYKNREELLVWKNRCDDKSEQIRQLEELIAVLQKRTAKLEAELATLRQQSKGKVLPMPNPSSGKDSA